ncbi:unnamed protein product [Clonostachys rosea]|uniref:Dipeptidylpeptidase IV N-terminal domain-containing protein n=1 Tax=Bionectria ochroleuca TaxID=29856 RepID=A0ABY6V1W0_BIOOC|nr:unnamed protein product [Clonostachys rosea]
MDEFASWHFNDLCGIRKPEFKPESSEQSRRAKLFEDELTSTLRQAIPSLPVEMHIRIAEFCIREFAAGRLTSLLEKGNWRFTVEVNHQSNVWASYIDFEGHRYVKSLYDEEDEELAHIDEHDRKQVYKAEDESNILFVKKNFLGVQDIIFGNSSNEPSVKEEQGVWWQVHSLPEDFTLTAKADRIKLRDIKVNPFEGPYPISRPQTLWSTPGAYHHHNFMSDDIRDVYPRFAFKGPRHMVSVDLKDPEMFGLSFSLHAVSGGKERNLAAIHVHTPGESLELLYGKSDQEHSPKTWKHIPFARGEVISEIWAKNIQRGVASAAQDTAFYFAVQTRPDYYDYNILIVTSRGQVHRIGTARNDPPRRWELVHRSASGPGRIYFERPEDEIAETWSIGFDSQDSNHELSSPTEQPASAPPCRSLEAGLTPPMMPINCSWVKLDNLVKVTACVQKLNKTPVDYVSGLLLDFADGSVNSLGDVRLDSLSEPQVVGDTTDLLRLRYDTSAGVRFIKACTIGPTRDGRDNLDVEIPLRGMLEWCHCRRDTWIWHDGELFGQT